MSCEDKIGTAMLLLAATFFLVGVAIAIKADSDFSKYQVLISQCMVSRITTKDFCESEAYLRVYK